MSTDSEQPSSMPEDASEVVKGLLKLKEEAGAMFAEVKPRDRGDGSEWACDIGRGSR